MPVLTYNLSPKSKILVDSNEEVETGTVLAEAKTPPKTHLLNLSRVLAVRPQKVIACLVKSIGDKVSVNDVLAVKKGFLGLGKKIGRSPVEGILESLENETGNLKITQSGEKILIKSEVKGKVEKAGLPAESAGEKTIAVKFKGLELKGKTSDVPSRRDKTTGILLTVTDLSGNLDLFCLDRSCREKIIAGNGKLTNDVLAKARALEVKGIVCGSFQKENLRYNFPLLSLGKNDRIEKEIWEELKRYEGKKAIIDGESLFLVE